MYSINQCLKKYIYRIIFCVCIFLPIGAQANILTFDSILSQGENNGDKYNGASWTTLKFKIIPKKTEIIQHKWQRNRKKYLT